MFVKYMAGLVKYKIIFCGENKNIIIQMPKSYNSNRPK